MVVLLWCCGGAMACRPMLRVEGELAQLNEAGHEAAAKSSFRDFQVLLQVSR